MLYFVHKDLQSVLDTRLLSSCICNYHADCTGVHNPRLLVALQYMLFSVM